jgi:hypothetical protein
LIWKSDRDTFLTEGNSIAIPELGDIGLAFGGLTFPESELISVDSGETLTLNMGNYDLPVMWYDSTAAIGAQLMGEEDNRLFTATESLTYGDLGFNSTSNATVWWNGVIINNTGAAHAGTSFGNITINATALNVSEGQRFIVTNIDADLSDTDTLYYEVATIDIDDGNTWTVELEDLTGKGNDLTFSDTINDSEDNGDVTARVIGFNQNNASVVLVFESAGNTLTYANAVSEKGMVVTLPTNNSARGAGANITFREADREDDLNLGRSFQVNVSVSANNRLHVASHNLTAFDEEESNDNFVGYVPSDFASKIMFDTSADEEDFSIEYYGDEVTGDVQVIAGGSVSTGGGLGDVLVTDAEVSSVSTKNLVVVGGSCINSAAASLVGSAYCGSAWTSATGVGAGQFLIKGYSSSSITSRLALLVAGYEAADTTNAATYLRTQSVDTSRSYKGTSATQASLVTTSA